MPRLQAAHELRFSDKLFEAPLDYIEKVVFLATESREQARAMKMKVYRERLTSGLEGW